MTGNSAGISIHQTQGQQQIRALEEIISIPTAWNLFLLSHENIHHVHSNIPNISIFIKISLLLHAFRLMMGK